MVSTDLRPRLLRVRRIREPLGAKRLAVALVVVSVAAVFGARALIQRQGERVEVPGVRSANVFFAYEYLRAAGLRVSLPDGLDTMSLNSTPTVWTQDPAAGSRIERGGAVTLYLSHGHAGSPAVPDVLPRARVPDLHGGAPSDAVAWAERHRLLVRLRLAPLHSGGARTLLANYRVTAQHPEPGEMLLLGVPRGRAWLPTPLTVIGQPHRPVPPSARRGRTAVPRLVGRTRSDAEALLDRLGIEWCWSERPTRTDRVRDQGTPQPGMTAPPDLRIRLLPLSWATSSRPGERRRGEDASARLCG